MKGIKFIEGFLDCIFFLAYIVSIALGISDFNNVAVYFFIVYGTALFQILYFKPLIRSIKTGKPYL